MTIPIPVLLIVVLSTTHIMSVVCVVQLTHAVMNKELKHCGHLEDLEVNENVKGKAKAYVVKYMSKYPGAYRPSNYSP